MAAGPKDWRVNVKSDSRHTTRSFQAESSALTCSVLFFFSFLCDSDPSFFHHLLDLMKYPAGPLSAHTHAGASTLLHLLADLDVDIEELGYATVQAHRLALVEVTLAVIGRDTLLGAGLGKTAVGLLH